MWGKLIGSLISPVTGLIANRQKRKAVIEKLTATTRAKVSLSLDERLALRIKNQNNSWGDEYILIWWTSLATYAAFGAPWGGDSQTIQNLLNDPVVLTFVGSLYGVRKFLK